MIAQFAAATVEEVKYLSNGGRVTDAITLHNRNKLCSCCPWRRGMTCSKCKNCLIAVKTRYATQFCPEKKW